MGMIADTRSTMKRIRCYARDLKALLSDYGVYTATDLKQMAEEPMFQKRLAAFGKSILKAEGGKVVGVAIFSIIGLAVGGVGIATGGAAIGLPLLAILAPAGFLGGQEFDAEGYSKKIVERLENFFGGGHAQT